MLGVPLGIPGLTTGRADAVYGPVCEGRLTLTSGTPVTTSDVTGATSVYLAPFRGNRLRVYNGSRWRQYRFTELTLALGTLTNAKNYDVFVYDNAGTLTLEAVAWTDDTTRATALTTQDGILVKNGATTRLYLGTFRTTATTTTEDSRAKRFLWNYYGRQPRQMRKLADFTNSSYNTTGAWRNANASTANRVEALVGVAEDPVGVDVIVTAVGATNTVGSVGIAYDQTAANDAEYYSENGGDSNITALARWFGYPAAGYHFWQWTEYVRANGSGAMNWYATGGALICGSGMTGWMMA